MPLQKVLHVDDDEAILRAVARFLEGKGLTVVSTVNPFVAPAIAKERPDVIVMDVDMPLLAGDRIVSIMRAHEFSTTPIVFFSAKPETRLDAIVAALPGSTYVRKESGLPALFERLRSVAGT